MPAPPEGQATDPENGLPAYDGSDLDYHSPLRSFMAAAFEQAHGVRPSQNWVHRIVHEFNHMGVFTIPEAVGELLTLYDETTLSREVANSILRIMEYHLEHEAPLHMEQVPSEDEFEDPDLAHPAVEQGRISKVNSNTWLGDTGASTHMGPDDSGMFNIRKVTSTVKVGSGESLVSHKVGDKRVTIIQADGTTMETVLKGFKLQSQKH